jgi:hypothetical protein
MISPKLSAAFFAIMLLAFSGGAASVLEPNQRSCSKPLLEAFLLEEEFYFSFLKTFVEAYAEREVSLQEFDEIIKNRRQFAHYFATFQEQISQPDRNFPPIVALKKIVEANNLELREEMPMLFRHFIEAIARNNFFVIWQNYIRSSSTNSSELENLVHQAQTQLDSLANSHKIFDLFRNFQVFLTYSGRLDHSKLVRMLVADSLFRQLKSPLNKPKSLNYDFIATPKITVTVGVFRRDGSLLIDFRIPKKPENLSLMDHVANTIEVTWVLGYAPGFMGYIEWTPEVLDEFHAQVVKSAGKKCFQVASINYYNDTNKIDLPLSGLRLIFGQNYFGSDIDYEDVYAQVLASFRPLGNLNAFLRFTNDMRPEAAFIQQTGQETTLAHDIFRGHLVNPNQQMREDFIRTIEEYRGKNAEYYQNLVKEINDNLAQFDQVMQTHKKNNASSSWLSETIAGFRSTKTPKEKQIPSKQKLEKQLPQSGQEPAPVLPVPVECAPISVSISKATRVQIKPNARRKKNRRTKKEKSSKKTPEPDKVNTSKPNEPEQDMKVYFTATPIILPEESQPKTIIPRTKKPLKQASQPTTTVSALSVPTQSALSASSPVLPQKLGLPQKAQMLFKTAIGSPVSPKKLFRSIPAPVRVRFTGEYSQFQEIFHLLVTAQKRVYHQAKISLEMKQLCHKAWTDTNNYQKTYEQQFQAFVELRNKYRVLRKKLVDNFARDVPNHQQWSVEYEDLNHAETTDQFLQTFMILTMDHANEQHDLQLLSRMMVGADGSVDARLLRILATSQQNTDDIDQVIQQRIFNRLNHSRARAEKIASFYQQLRADFEELRTIEIACEFPVLVM